MLARFVSQGGQLRTRGAFDGLRSKVRAASNKLANPSPRVLSFSVAAAVWSYISERFQNGNNGLMAAIMRGVVRGVCGRVVH